MTVIAVRLPDDLVAALDRMVKAGRFPTRSDAIREAIDLLVSTSERLAADRAIVESYTRQPQTDEELRLARRHPRRRRGRAVDYKSVLTEHITQSLQREGGSRMPGAQCGRGLRVGRTNR